MGEEQRCGVCIHNNANIEHIQGCVRYATPSLLCHERLDNTCHMICTTRCRRDRRDRCDTLHRRGIRDKRDGRSRRNLLDNQNIRDRVDMRERRGGRDKRERLDIRDRRDRRDMWRRTKSLRNSRPRQCVRDGKHNRPAVIDFIT